MFSHVQIRVFSGQLVLEQFMHGQSVMEFIGFKKDLLMDPFKEDIRSPESSMSNASIHL